MTFGNTYKLDLARNTIAPGGVGAVGTLTLDASQVTLTNATLNMDLLSVTSVDQLVVTNATTTNATLVLTNAALSLNVDPGFKAPSSPTNLFLIVVSGTNATVGAFNGLPEGARVSLGNAAVAQISYRGDYANNTVGTGNDVVLYNAGPAGGMAIFLQ